MKAQLRGIYAIEDENPHWKEAVKNFPNYIPRFKNKNIAQEFIKNNCLIGSNPLEPHLTHSITTLTDWNQITKYLLPKIEEYSTKFKLKTYNNVDYTLNRYINENPITNYLESRYELSVYKNISDKSTFNTLKYLFYHMRCGIYVMIKDNRVVIFCPFVNKDYTNTWGDVLKIDSIDGTIESYFQEKSHHYREENYIKDKNKWWANGNIICNEISSSDDSLSQYWGDHFLFQLKDMIAETCSHRQVPDCEFFINKRDYPHLKFNNERDRAVEPYGFIYDKDDRISDDDIDLTRHLYKAYTPIMSFYTSDRFADIPIPPSEDWEAATGEVFPSSFDYSLDKDGNLIVGSCRDLFTADNLKNFERNWEDKMPTALFRGTATGGGTTLNTNQRLLAADFSHRWSLDPRFNGTSTDNNFPYLDAKITSWNLRDKKIYSSKMTYIHKDNFNFIGDKKKNFIPIYEQSSYKYILYIEGHCAACRYAFMMLLGSVIFKVSSLCVADQIWYFPILKPYYDHIPIKADLSDLQEKIEWCRTHDDECKQIALNAKKVYDEYICRDAILDYLQLIFINISKRYIYKPLWTDNIYNKQDITHLEEFDPPNFNITKQSCCDKNELCPTCKRSKELEDSINRNKRSVPSDNNESNNNITDIKKKRRLESIALAKEMRNRET